MNQGTACLAAQCPYSAARDWVVQLFDTAQQSQGREDADIRSACLRWSSYWFWSGGLVLIRYQHQQQLVRRPPQQRAASPGLVFWVLFASPALWSLLIGHHYTPHYPIRAWLEGGNRPWWWMVRFGEPELHNSGAMTNIGSVDNC